MSGDLERKVCSLVRHICLGCSTCRQAEVIVALTEWPQYACTTGEALLVIDLLAAQYMASEKGKTEMGRLLRGEQPGLDHNDAGPLSDDGYPPPADVPAPALVAEVRVGDELASIGIVKARIDAVQNGPRACHETFMAAFHLGVAMHYLEEYAKCS